ncbi:MAG: hypothetical protein JO097_07570 [Acidobacteriaceae bacterium]|nr:hypothetical protein [Acidobacteriaceae bacterium]MBV9766707.1 hypothetical protein [Acidobacteriaceae bacterium]
MAQIGSSLRVSELGGLFDWLIDHGVSSDRIGSLLRVTPVNVRVIASRWRRRLYPHVWSTEPLPVVPDEGERQSLGIRSHPDEVLNNSRRESSLEQLNARLDRITAASRSQHEYRRGIDELNGLLRVIGYAADSRRIALRAGIHEQLAWFNCQLGHSASALQETHRSTGLWRTAHHESIHREERRKYALGYERAALAGSNAALLGQRPTVAWELLQRGAAAADSIGEPLGSDHFRQKGVACFQLRQDALAEEYFEKAGHAAHDIGDAWTPATPLLAADRHISLIGRPNWDRTLEIRDIVGKFFGDNSLQYSMATTWAAACGLISDSEPLWQSARELLQTNVALAERFDHQATVTRLLSIAPELGLYSRLLALYVRRALYENVSRRF